MKHRFGAGVGILLMLMGSPCVLAQGIPLPTDLNLSEILIPGGLFQGSGDLEVGAVVLDGRPLFSVAAVRADGEEESFPLAQRIEFVEARLLQLAQSELSPTTLRAMVQVDPDTNQPVITVNGQYVLTVTSLDAQVQGLDPREWAEQVGQIIQGALVSYYEERQPEVIWRRMALALALGLGAWLATAGLERWRIRLVTRRDRVRAELVQIPSFPVLPEVEEREGSLDEVGLGSPQDAQFVKRLHRLELRLDLQQRLLWGLGVALWGGALGLGVGLFPQTRWIQVTGLRWLQGPLLRLGSSALVTYVAVRLSAHTIEGVFQAVRENQWLIIQPENSTQDRISKRIVTLTNVVKGVTGSLIILIGGITAIALIGVNVIPLVTSLGVIGLGVSLAAQDLIKDFINGLMILLEDQFAEGDVIVVDGRGGFVERINLRITQLRNTEGALITIPNSAIRVVENLSNGWSRVDMNILVAYSTDIDQAMRVIESVAVRMSREWDWKDRILDHPQMLGVDQFEAHGILLRIWIKVRPLAQWDVAREFRRRLKLAFDQNGIHFPLPQREIWVHQQPSP